MMTPADRPVRSFVVLCVVAALGLGAYYAWIRKTRFAPAREAPPPVTTAPSSTSAANAGPPSTRAGAAPSLPTPTAVPHASPPSREILFRHNAVDSHYGHVARVGYPDAQERRFVDGMSCEVLHFAAGRGVCLTADRRVVTTYRAEILDSGFRKLFTVPLAGGPSRCRVSRDGRLAAATVFVTGHSYASLDFSTQTLLLDTATGEVLADLESFRVTRGGQPFSAPDFNFWGVTFTPDSKRFYCTLSTNGRHYLARGDVASRTAEVLHENVECPSLSPDGRHIAYKKRLPARARVEWQLHVLEVSSMHETPLPETRSADDQIEWLDDANVLYALPQGEQSASTDVWRVSLDGRTPPEVFLHAASSPAVLR
jgi:hypothetical protein